MIWGDVTRVEGDVYTVGHYEGVEPQRAELALDRLVSGVSDDMEPNPRGLVITQHSRRGMLRGAVGGVSFFPSPAGLVAVAGMGRPGTFDRGALRQLARSLMLAITALPDVRTVCSVLIGSGEGTLTVADAVRGLIAGVGEAVEELRPDEAFPAIKIVERERGRAEEIHDVLTTVAAELLDMQKQGRRVSALIDVRGKLKTAPSGTVSLEDSIALLAQGAVDATGEPGGEAHVQELLARASTTRKVRGLALAELRRAGGSATLGLRVSRAPDSSSEDGAVRISFWIDGPAIKTAAIHSAATVAERLITVGSDVVDELVAQMTDPRAEDVAMLCRLLHRLLVPTEFRDVLHAGPLVFEVDRAMARVHWEMLAAAPRDDGRQVPLAVSAPLARQIRTQYSPAPLPPRHPRARLRALVIGDPGDPGKGQDLPGARREALRVVELLRERNVEVEARIGAPGVPREGALGDIRAADRLEVLGLLLDGGFDILHYAGHGDFDPSDPRRAGWLFATGLLTAGEIGRIEHVPSVVVANACLSARTSRTMTGARRAGEEPSEAGLLPSLADEFFHLGVRDYVGTAWEVNDIGAELFAEVFYETLLPLAGGAGESLGQAVKQARTRLWDRSDDFGALWAAYQHYGDPTNRERVVRRPTGRGRTPSGPPLSLRADSNR